MSKVLVKKGYDKAANKYAASRVQFDIIKSLHKFTLHIPKRRTILDVGRGTGRPLDDYLIKNGYAVNGIDIAKRMVELA